MSVSKEDLRLALDLSRLDVGEDEIGPLTDHLNSMLDYFGKLDGLDLSAADTLTLEDGRPMRLRKDEAAPWTDRDSILNQSPSREGDFIKVPRIGGER